MVSARALQRSIRFNVRCKVRFALSASGISRDQWRLAVGMEVEMEIRVAFFFFSLQNLPIELGFGQ